MGESTDDAPKPPATESPAQSNSPQNNSPTLPAKDAEHDAGTPESPSTLKKLGSFKVVGSLVCALSFVSLPVPF